MLNILNLKNNLQKIIFLLNKILFIFKMKNLSFFLYIFLLVNIISKPKIRRTSVTRQHKKKNPPPYYEPPKEEIKKE